MECDSNGHLPQKLIVKIPTCLTYVENRRRRGWTHGDYSHIKDLLIKYHNTETLFYEYARNVDGVPRIFLSRPLTADDNKGIICMEHLEGAHTRPVYENISIEEMKSILKLYANIQKGCARIPDGACAQLNTNVFELLSTTTLSLETLTQRLTRMALWAPEMTSTLQKLVQFLSQIVNHTTVTCLHSECPFRHLLVHGDLYSSNILWQNGIVKAVIDYQVPQLMAKAEPLPESHKGKNLAKEMPKLSKCRITLEFGRSHLTTYNFVEDSTVYGIMVHYGNPVEDLIRLFTTGLTVSERKAHTIELLDYYRRQITSLIPDLEGSLTVDWFWSCYKKIFPMAGLWALVSLHASYESATSQTSPDSIKLKTVVEKIHGIAAEILEMFS